MTLPTFGVVISPTENDTAAVISADMSVVGLIGTAPDADTSAFPLDTPVLVYSSDSDTLAKLGLDGTLLSSIKLLHAQLGGGAAKIVVVRIAEGNTPADTVANAIGDGLTTGIHAFLDAPVILGVTPRLIGAPGLCGIRAATGVANGLAAALPPVLDALFAHAVIDAPGTDLANDLDWRETLDSRRLIAVTPAVVRTDNGESITVPASAAILGLAVYVDNINGGLPFKSWANRSIAGVESLTRGIRFNLLDGATEGQDLLANNIGIIVRSERGVVGSAQGGFVYYGTDNLSTDELWNFYNVSRGRDYLHLLTVGVVQQYLGRYSLTGHTVQSILNTMRNALTSLQAQGAILGSSVSFNAVDNPTADLREGRLVVQFNAEETPVLRRVTIKSGRMATAVDAMVADLAGA